MIEGIILRNGMVFNIDKERFEFRDIFIKNGKFANPYSHSEEDKYIHEFDAEGLLITPPLVDFHCHLYLGGVDNAADPLLLPATGVLYACDAGSAGISNILGLHNLKHQVQDRLKMYNWLNLSRIGIIAENVPEAQPELCINPEDFLSLKEDVRKDLVGIMVRISHRSTNDSINVCTILDKAVSLAASVGLPLMVKISRPCFPIDLVMEKLMPGDVVSEIFHDNGEGILDGNGRVKKSFWKKKNRGVLFDTAHGRYHFSFAVAQKCIEQGFYPDFISTNLTSRTAFLPPVYGMADLLSKHMALGMSLEEVFIRATKNPADYLKIKGYPVKIEADEDASLVAWEVKKGNWDFVDSYGVKIRGEKLLNPVFVIKDGRFIYKREDRFI